MNSRDQNNKSPLLLQLPKTYSDMSGNSFLIPVAVENVAEAETSQPNVPVTSSITETAPFSQLEQPLFCRRPSDPKMAVPYSETNTPSRNIASVQPVESHSGPIAPPLQSALGVNNQFSDHHLNQSESKSPYPAVGPPPLTGYPNEPPTIYPESVGEFHNTTPMHAAYSSQPPVMPVTDISMNLRKDATPMPYIPLSNSNQSFNNQQLSETPTTEFYSRYYEPVKPYWLFLVIVESKEVWYGFSEIDSHNLEVAFQQNPEAIVPVDGGRYDAILSDRIKKPVYFEAKDMQISRATWFYRRSSSQRFLPFPEIASDVLEQNYANCVVSGQWPKRVDIPGIGSVIMESPQVLLYYKNEVEMWPTLPDSKVNHQPVKRCLPENFEIMASENNRIDHLVFIVQGIGSFCDLRFRTVSECVDGFRDISDKLLAVHFKQELQSDQVGRVEFLPLAWHAKLHTCEKGFDKHMQKITLPSIPKLRHFTNDTLLDILLYSSPTYCQSIIDTVASELNKLYEIFLRRNQDFSGKVFVAGHSLGSLILFDILANQNPDEIQLNPNEINDQIKDTIYESSLSKNPQDLKTTAENNILQVISENNIQESFDSLSSLLEACHLEEYADLFEKEKVDLSSVSLMSNEDLKDLGLPAGPRKKLISVIHSSKQKSSDGGAGGDSSVLPSSSSSQSTISDSQNQLTEFEMQNVSEDSESLKFPIRTSPCMSSIKYPKLHFEPACFFALGSPISMFLTVRGYAQISEEFRFPTCPGFFHIFHPYDPVAFRIEPLIEPTFSAKPVLIPHHKGRKRMHLEIRENLSKVGSEIKQRVIETLRYTWDSLSGFARAHSLSAAVEAEVNKLMRQQQISESSYELRAPSETSGEDIQIGSLNGGRRIDYVLQEKPIEALNDYIFALTSHATYWDSEDTVLMILREIYATQGILLSNQSLESKYSSAYSFQDSGSKLNTAVSDPVLYQDTQMDLQSINVSSFPNPNQNFPAQSDRTQQSSINFMDPYQGTIPMSQTNVPPPAPQFYSPNSASFSQPFEPPPVSTMQTVLPPPTSITQPSGSMPVSESVSQFVGPSPVSVSQPLGPPPAPVSQPLGPPPLTGFVKKSPFTR